MKTIAALILSLCVFTSCFQSYRENIKVDSLFQVYYEAGEKVGLDSRTKEFDLKMNTAQKSMDSSQIRATSKELNEYYAKLAKAINEDVKSPQKLTFEQTGSQERFICTDLIAIKLVANENINSIVNQLRLKIHAKLDLKRPFKEFEKVGFFFVNNKGNYFHSYWEIPDKEGNVYIMLPFNKNFKELKVIEIE